MDKYIKDNNGDIKSKEQIVSDNNTPIYKELDNIDRKSIRAMREGDDTRMNALEDEAMDLRRRLM